MPHRPNETFDLIVAGGGAAGFFAAIACAEHCPEARIVILEKSREVLGKVKISGGGRCNVTHACFDPRELTEFYPRGAKCLIGPFHHWGPAETMAWFEERKVPLKIEDDNRVFPKSDSSQSIMDCLMHAARRAGIAVRTSTALATASKDDAGIFCVKLESGDVLESSHLILTTGGTRSRIGEDVASSFGHSVQPAAPSLFTFRIRDRRLKELQGVSVPSGRVRVEGTKLEATGPLLITHWGLSGPGILRVSAWGARELQQRDYQFQISVNWCGGREVSEVLDRFDQLRSESPKRGILNDPQFDLPSRLWKRLVESVADNAADLRWPHLPRQVAERLAAELAEGRFQVSGKAMNKDEFVTCGGVELREVQFKTMESRVEEGLYFAGEVLDIDGITGGFNFQSAWTTGRIAGEAIAESILERGPLE